MLSARQTTFAPMYLYRENTAPPYVSRHPETPEYRYVPRRAETPRFDSYGTAQGGMQPEVPQHLSREPMMPVYGFREPEVTEYLSRPQGMPANVSTEPEMPQFIARTQVMSHYDLAGPQEMTQYYYPSPQDIPSYGSRQLEDEGTSYTSMNEWLHQPGKSVPPRPTVSTRNDWRTLPTRGPGEGEEDEDQYPELPRPRGPDDSYKRTYDDLTKQIAYRWPNPGSPRHREGSLGGTWRHIKEVLGHSGSRVVFVDGLVSVYDNQKFTQQLQSQLPYRPHIKPLYAALKGEATPGGSFSKHTVLPDVHAAPASSHLRDPNLEGKLRMQERFQASRRGPYAFH